MKGSEEWNFSPSPQCSFSLPTQDMSSWSLTYCEVIHVFDNLMEKMDRTKILDSFGERVPVILADFEITFESIITCDITVGF